MRPPAGPVVLVGLPGCGKSTVGRVLARQIGRDLFDCDAVFEAETGKSIAGWITEHGWPAFRERERELLAAGLKLDNLVVATGGGAVEDAENRAALAGTWAVVWLDVRFEILAERLQAAHVRPLLGGEPRRRLEELARRRDSLYREVADFVVCGDRLDAKRVAVRIAERLNLSRKTP